MQNPQKKFPKSAGDSPFHPNISTSTPPPTPAILETSAQVTPLPGKKDKFVKIAFAGVIIISIIIIVEIAYIIFIQKEALLPLRKTGSPTQTTR